jgi:acetyl-CoA acetyltransferase
MAERTSGDGKKPEIKNLKDGVYLIGGVRTAIGGFCGAFDSTPAPALGSVVVKAALQRAGVSKEKVDEVIFGNVVSAGLGRTWRGRPPSAPVSGRKSAPRPSASYAARG